MVITIQTPRIIFNEMEESYRRSVRTVGVDFYFCLKTLQRMIATATNAAISMKIFAVCIAIPPLSFFCILVFCQSLILTWFRYMCIIEDDSQSIASVTSPCPVSFLAASM